jgi:hypothetical protein
VIIGSSPICIIEAIYQSKSRENILLVESDDNVGGAWKTIRLFDVEDVELGPHLIYSSCDNRDVYRFLSHLGIFMEFMSPEPAAILSGRFLGIKKIPIRRHWVEVISALFDGLSRKNSVPPLEIKRLLNRAITSVIKQMLGFFSRPMYPQGGSSELIGKLAKIIDPNRVEVRLNTKVNALTIDKANQTAILHTNESNILADKIILTSHARLTAIREDGASALKLELQTSEFTLLHLLLRDARPPVFSYVRFYNHDLLVRMSDLTKYARLGGDTEGLRILCLHIHQHSHGRNNYVEKIFDFLKCNNYVGADASIMSYNFADCNDSFLTANTVNAISRKYAPIIETLRTDDNLSYAISTNLNRWRDDRAAHPD